jgi:hypothetical protein
MALRGRCGGPISPDLPGVPLDGPALIHLGPEFNAIRGRPFIRDTDVFREPLATGEDKPAGRWLSCPTAEMRSVAEIVAVYRHHKLGLGLGVDQPSAALLDGLAVLAETEIELHNAGAVEDVRNYGG